MNINRWIVSRYSSVYLLHRVVVKIGEVIMVERKLEFIIWECLEIFVYSAETFSLYSNDQLQNIEGIKSEFRNCKSISALYVT
jgi:hypothetical protein